MRPDRVGCEVMYAKQDDLATTRRGYLRAWGMNHDDYGENGPAPWPCAIVEEAVSGQVVVVYAGDVRFVEPIGMRRPG